MARSGRIAWKDLHVLADHREADADDGLKRNRGQGQEEGSEADQERPVAVRKDVYAQLVRAGLEIDGVVHLDRQLEVEPGRGHPARVGSTPRLEGGGRHDTRGPELVAAVATVVDEARGAKTASGAVDGQIWVGHVDIARPSGFSHVKFWILVDPGGWPGRPIGRRYTLGPCA